MTTVNIEKLNEDIKQFPQVAPITANMKESREGVGRLVMLDRYAFKDLEMKTLAEGDFVVLTIKDDPKFPARGTGFVRELDRAKGLALVEVEEEFHAMLEPSDDAAIPVGHVRVSINALDKPLEIYYEQIAHRNATFLASVEKETYKQKVFEQFYQIQADLDFVPAGRVLFGAGSGSETTFFNCYVMPFIQDSRGGIAAHRGTIMEIMSRGGGVGTNGSTLRPKNALAKGVNGRSSGAVGWMNDIAQLTHLVEQGGSRKGAQMLMLNSWHPDIIEFIISKMQNPRILRFLIENMKDPEIITMAKNKLKFKPFTATERAMYESIVNTYENSAVPVPDDVVREAKQKLEDGGHYSVHNPDFLTGANISVCLTEEFMAALENDGKYELKFPDIDNYNDEEKAYYNEQWHEVGDVRAWEHERGQRVRVHRTIKASESWRLINICATYAAEPGIFFLDRANEMTNAVAYDQRVVATNPCGEQALSPYAVCNLAAINLANMVNKETKTVDFEKLRHTVSVGIRAQDNVIDATPYFLEENKKQALGERRVGLGVMGLADLLIYCEKEYGSAEGNALIDQVFECIATTAYRTSIELAKEKGPFPFLDTLPNGQPNVLGREKFIDSGYMKRMPADIRHGILEHGIRNSHLLTVAPTGSTGTMIGGATGLEPYFSFAYYRSGRLGENIEVNAKIVDEYLAANPGASKDNLPRWFVSAMQLSPEAHADVQCVIQRWIDSSISKTVNAPKGFTVEQVQEVYERLYKGGAKGGTVYVDGSRDTQVLKLKNEEQVEEVVETEEQKVILVETINELTTTSTNTKYGSDIGDTCPICRKGKMRNAGGCITCDNCNAQTRCGL